MMINMRLYFLSLLFIFSSFCIYADIELQEANKLFYQGNYKEAYSLYSKLCFSDKISDTYHMRAFNLAISSLNQLNKGEKTDELRTKMLEYYPENWKILTTVAKSYIFANSHSGRIVAGKFIRGGQNNYNSEIVNSFKRDRTKTVQLLFRALKLIKNASPIEQSSVYITFADTFYKSDSSSFFSLTDLSGELPDYEKGYAKSEHKYPVDKKGNPIFFYVPASFESAKNDAERWRWLLQKAIDVVPENKYYVSYALATYFESVFSVSTISSQLWGRSISAREKKGICDLHSLKENETIAYLATGIKRFRLPDEFNYIKRFQKIAKSSNADANASLMNLARIFSNRRQYAKSAKYWKENIKRFGDNNNHKNAYKWKQKTLDQIIKNWGRFEYSRMQASNKLASLPFTFRNAKKVFLKAYRIKINDVIKDLKDYLKSNPATLRWDKINLNSLGQRLVYNNEKKYIGEKVVEWTKKLSPSDEHFNKQIIITTPIKKAGVYLLTAQLKNGNTSRIILWITDSVIMQKKLKNAELYYIANSANGKPIPNAKLSFFSYKQTYLNPSKKSKRRYNIEVMESKFTTNKNGLLKIKSGMIPNGYNSLLIYKGKNNSIAYLGFNRIWYSNYYESRYQKNKTFAITDRPVYTPKQVLKFKFWLRQSMYDMEDISLYANQSVSVVIRNPKNIQIFKKTFVTDQYGGLNGEFNIPDKATLGIYNLSLYGYSGNTTFRVEEYKKPEYEVKIEAPSKPVKLGDKITVILKAKYYFGTPVAYAKVKYKVLRYAYDTQWYPVMPWDWFYGNGYWWFAYNYDWYPGWKNWACKRPRSWWFPQPYTPPELVMENEAEIGKDGTVKICINTAIAKEIFQDQDQRYEIIAEVTDKSRRTIVGKTSVIATVKPFKVTVWSNKGYYRTNEEVKINFKAFTVNNKAIKGKALLKLFRISYDKLGDSKEVLVKKWDLATNDDGFGELQFVVSKSGQYRISSMVSFNEDNVEGGYIFNVNADTANCANFNFNNIEIITKKREYTPGDKLELLINTQKANSTVLLFIRAVNGIYPNPRILHIKGKSTIERINISKKDIPNFFVEAVTIHNAQIFSTKKEIIVPPIKRLINVEVIPSKKTYRPGENAKVKLKLTDVNGDPIKASVVVSIYDKSLEYISGGTNIAEIRAFFWKWRRNHYSSNISNITQTFSNLFKKKEVQMRDLGIFGYLSESFDDRKDRGKRNLFKKVKRKARKMESVLSVSGSLADSVTEEKELSSFRREKYSNQASEKIKIRKEFADSAFWVGDLETNSEGIAEVKLNMPENLTTWKIKVWSLTHGTKVGEGETEVITSKNVIIRMQAPRFFIEKDEVLLSAIVHNYLKSAKSAQISIKLSNETLELMDKNERTTIIEPSGEKRINWRVKVKKEGDAQITMTVKTNEESDAMQMHFPVYVHGMLKTVSFSRSIRDDKDISNINFKVPFARRTEQTSLEINYSPSLANIMIDALPYLADYPYGCTEQTLNRFLPTLITQKVLKDMNINLAELKDRKTCLKNFKLNRSNPVFDNKLVNDMVNKGIKRLTFMQNSDGGWGWFSGYNEHSYAHTTALVVNGLNTALKYGGKFDKTILTNGIKWLENYQNKQVEKLKNAVIKKEPWAKYASNIDAFIFMVLVNVSKVNDEMKEFLYRDRTKLTTYSKTMYAIALHLLKDTKKFNMLMRNIKQYLEEDDENQTAYLNLPNNYWWYSDKYETQAYFLKLLSLTEPQSTLASRVAKYIVNNRANARYWKSTRDTALCVEALADYISTSKENKSDMTLDILYDHRLIKTVKVSSKNIFKLENKFILGTNMLTGGEHKITFRRRGTGPLYFNVQLSYFTLEDYIKKTGLEIKVQRKYYKLTKLKSSENVQGARGQIVQQKTEKFKRTLIKNMGTLKSGDLCQVELIIDSKNDYEYLIFEDMKPAGFEPVEVRSGYTDNEINAYVEFRNEKVAFFIRYLTQGRHSVSYRIRAEIPGKFSALPTKGYAMYSPDLKTNSDEIKLQIKDATYDEN